MNIREIIDVLKSGIPTTNTIMLWGPPGVGKSASVRQAAAELGEAMGAAPLPVIDLRLTQLDPTDLKGIPVPEVSGPDTERICSWASPSALPRVWRDGPEGFLLLDEINSAPQLVQAAAYELTLDRRLGEYSIPPGWRVVCAGNRRGDGGVTYKMPTPLANRMIHIEAEASIKDWKTWAYAKEIHPAILAFLSQMPDRLLDFDPSKSETAFPTPRSWEMTNRILQENLPAEKLRNELIRGCIGLGTASDFIAYLKLEADLPNFDAIMRGYGADQKLPTTPSSRFLVTTALVSRVNRLKDKTSLRHALEYAVRLPQEFSTLFFVDMMAHLRGQGSNTLKWLAEEPIMQDWLKRNGALVRNKV